MIMSHGALGGVSWWTIVGSSFPEGDGDEDEDGDWASFEGYVSKELEK